MIRSMSAKLRSYLKAMTGSAGSALPIRFVAFVLGGAAVWAMVNSWRYETHPLSRNAYVLEDRLVGRVYYCQFERCRIAKSPRPVKVKIDDDSNLTLDDAAARASGETQPAAPTDGEQDWTKLNDDQLLEAALGQSLDDFSGNAPVPQPLQVTQAPAQQ